jgi:hypothetical protein
MSDDTQDPDDPNKEIVGKGRPPKAHRFKPGTSGNPKGRPTGCRNFRKVFESVLDREVEIKWNGGVDTVTLAEAVCLVLAKAAMNGDSRAIESFLVRAEKYTEVDKGAESLAELPEDDEAILARALTQRVSPHQQDARDETRAPTRRRVDDSDAGE